MSNPTITSDSSNITVSNANLICDNDILANAFFDVNGIVLSGGGGGGGPSSDTLSDVVNRGNVTSNTVQFTNTGMSLVTSGSISVGNQIQTPVGAIVITNSNNSITTSNVNATYLGAIRNITSPYSSNILMHTLDNEIISADLSLNTLSAGGFTTTGVVTAGTFSGDGGTLSNLATVALTGSYLDISNKPSFSTVAFTGAYSDLINIPASPSLATVATTGAYSDLSGAPTIPTNTSDLTNDSNFVASTSLATVATTGAYSDLSGTPTLATVATTGAYSDLSGTPTIPTNTSDLTNDSNFATTSYVTSEISNVVGSAPAALDTLNELASALDNDANFAGTVTTSIATKLSIADAANTYATTASLATVATSGAYSDLSGTPTLATVATSGAYSDLSGTPTLATVATSGAYSDLSGTPTIPTNTSDLTNDSNFVTSTSLATVATSGAYSDLSGTPSLATVATTGAYSDLSGTPTLATVATSGAYSDLSGTPTLATVATSGAYSDLSGTPTIPTNTSDLTNDSNFVTSTSLATVATSGAYSDLSGTPSLATVATTGAYSDLSGAPTSITDLDVTDGTSGQFLTTDGAGTFTFATVSASGSSTLQQVTDTGNTTSNTVILTGGFVTGNNATSVTATSNALTLDMDGKSYKTFTCSTSNSIETITISNDILGSQGMIFLTATGDINIFGTTSNLGGTNVNVSYDDISVSSGERALIGFMSDGTQRYINAAKYPSAGGGGGLSNLETITTNGNVATTTVQLTNSDVGLVATGNVQANYFIGDGSQLTNLPSGGGGGGTQAYIDVYDATGGQTAPTGGVVLNLDTTRISSGNFTLSSDTVVFNKAGTYKIDFRVTTTVTSATRSDSYAQLYKNNSLVAGSRVYMYNRQSTTGENTGAAAAILSMASSDYISIKVFEESGAVINTVINGSGVVITELLT